MVRQLEEKDYQEMMDLLSIDPIINCYMISDLQHIGFGESYVTFYGSYKEDRLCSIFMVYDAYGMIYSVDNDFEEAFIEVIKNAPLKSLSGQDQTIRILHRYFSDYSVSPMTLACLQKTSERTKHSHIKTLTSYAEMEELYHLLKDIEEFNVKTQTKEEFIREKQNLNEHGSIYGIYREKQLIASASVISETKTHAVINGVATHRMHRKKGYANDLIDQIIYDYIGERNMGLILYYDNPEAGKIYKRKGFLEKNIWSSIKLYEKCK